jgi:hypothetical protein
VPQIVVFVMRTIASVGFAIVGSGLSSRAFWPGPWNTNAFMTTSIASLGRLAYHREPPHLL